MCPLSPVPYRSSYSISTIQHRSRVAQYAVWIYTILQAVDKATNERYNFTEQEIYNMVYMHDVGKRLIPMSILNKPGKLNDIEWKIMQRHTQLAEDLLRNKSLAVVTLEGNSITESEGLSICRIAQTVAIQHHERWDGAGYPYGLETISINFVARLTSICDSLDAMLEVRPYKCQLGINDALRELLTNEGKQFDPYIVASVLERNEEFIDMVIKVRNG